MAAMRLGQSEEVLYMFKKEWIEAISRPYVYRVPSKALKTKQWHIQFMYTKFRLPCELATPWQSTVGDRHINVCQAETSYLRSGQDAVASRLG